MQALWYKWYIPQWSHTLKVGSFSFQTLDLRLSLLDFEVFLLGTIAIIIPRFHFNALCARCLYNNSKQKFVNRFFQNWWPKLKKSDSCFSGIAGEKFLSARLIFLLYLLDFFRNWKIKLKKSYPAAPERIHITCFERNLLLQWFYHM